MPRILINKLTRITLVTIAVCGMGQSRTLHAVPIPVHQRNFTVVTSIRFVPLHACPLYEQKSVPPDLTEEGEWLQYTTTNEPPIIPK